MQIEVDLLIPLLCCPEAECLTDSGVIKLSTGFVLGVNFGGVVCKLISIVFEKLKFFLIIS